MDDKININDTNSALSNKNSLQNVDKKEKKEKKRKDKEERKSLLRARIFIILVGVCVILIGLLIYAIVAAII